MQHTYSWLHRVGAYGVCAMAIILLSACATHTYQEEKGATPSAELNQLYRLRQETPIWNQFHLPRHERYPSNYLPYSIECQSQIYQQPCSQPSVVKLPAGTLVELVGINEHDVPLVDITRTLIFAVHDIPVLDTVLFQAPSRWTGIGRYSELDEVAGDSRWTTERLEKVIAADWVKKHQVDIRRLVVDPRKVAKTANASKPGRLNGIGIRKVNWRGWKELVEVKDNQNGFSFVLPSGWTITDTPESTETNKSPWHMILLSADKAMTLRVGHRPVGQLTLIDRITNYVGTRVGVSTKEEIDSNVRQKIKSLTPEEYLQFNIDSGYVVHVLTPSLPGSVVEWQQESLLAVQKDGELFFFSLLAKSDFYKKKSNDLKRDFAVPENPIFTLAESLRFISARKE